ncbi:MAG: tetratricopeptide repeat protein [Crocinitomicaceae bacterium]|nr:tetratricopeptide repeat protein [Flavobacteriales bacterium]NQZ34900.1 tetratricopeptide repeat protein [Crocinitomicaceae bacterium]
MSPVNKFNSTLDYVDPLQERVDILLKYCVENKIRNWKESLEAAQQAKKLATECNYENGVALANLEIGYQYWLSNKYDDALKLLDQSLSVLSASTLYYKFARATAVKASIFWSKGDRKIAISTIFNGLSYVRSLSRPNDGLWLEWFLGIFYYDLKDYENSEKQYLRAIEIIEELNYRPKDAYAYCLIGLGGVQFATDRTSQALHNFTLAREYSLQNGLWMQHARVLHDLGTYFIKKNEYVKSKEYYTKSYAIRKKNNIKAALISSILALVELESDPNKALALAKEGLKYSTQQEIPQKIASSHFALSKVYQRLNNYELSHRHLEKANDINTQLSEHTYSSEMKTLEAQFLVDLLKRESEILQKQNSILKKANTIITDQYEEIKRQNRDKNLLLKEIHHRVKNNLQLITSMIHLQKNKLTDPKAIQALENSEKRIEAIALVHQFLYQDDNMERILLHDYLHQLIHASLSYSSVQHTISCPEIRIKTKLMTSLALIVSELLSNSMKYSFIPDDKNKKIDLIVTKDSNSHVLIRIIDNGVGLPPGFNLNSNFEGLGLELVKLLCEQIDAKISSFNHSSGSEFQIEIHLK